MPTQPVTNCAGIHTRKWVEKSREAWRITLYLFVCLLSPATCIASDKDNYLLYHQSVNDAEKLIAAQQYGEALVIYRQLFDTYDFVFLRDYRIAAQLALHTGNPDEAFIFLKKGIASGWTLKSIKKNKFLRKLRISGDWRTVERQYDSLRGLYQAQLNSALRATVKKLFSKDQWKALGGLFAFGEKARNRYARKKFAPQSEKQVAQLNQIIDAQGYPGERLIGNNYWAETILSHHNSMTVELTQSDTLYPSIRPKLLRSIQSGQMSPYEFALIDDWYITIGGDRQKKGYGYLQSLTETERVRANALRQEIGLRSIEVRNQLIEVQQQTGMNFYLPSRPQPNGKI